MIDEPDNPEQREAERIERCKKLAEWFGGELEVLMGETPDDTVCIVTVKPRSE